MICKDLCLDIERKITNTVNENVKFFQSTLRWTTAYSAKKIVLKEQNLQRMICTRVAQVATLTSLSKFKSCSLLVVKQMLNGSAFTIIVARGRLLST